MAFKIKDGVRVGLTDVFNNEGNLLVNAPQVASRDGSTYISAVTNNTSGADDNTLRFGTDGVERLTLTTNSATLASSIATMNINATTASTGTTSGALVVAGGVGIGGDLYAATATFSGIEDTPIGSVTPSTGAFTQADVDDIRIDGNTISSTNTDGNITLDPNGDGYVQIAGTNGLVIPVGTTAQQGPAVSGAIRLNSTTGQFEGYSGSNWASLGGVRSVDGLTYITAESSPGASDDTLSFYTADSNSTSTLAATLDKDTFTINAATDSTDTSTGALVVVGGVGIGEDLNVGGNTNITGNLTVDGTVTMGSASFTSLDNTPIGQNGGADLGSFTALDSTSFTNTGDTTLGTATENTITTIYGTANATNKDTGAVIIAEGGLGVELNIHAGGDITADGDINADFDVNAGANLNVVDNADIGGTFNADGAATLGGTLAVTSNTTVGGTLGVTGATTLDSTLNVTGAATFSNNASVGATLEVTGATTLNSTLDVTGAADFASTLNADGAATLGSTLDVTSNTTIGGTLTVTGISTLNDDLTVNADASVTGTLTVDGGLTLNSNASSTNTTTGALVVTGGVGIGENLNVGGYADVAGTFNADGAATLGSTLDVTGNTTVGGTFDADGAATLGSTLNVTGATELDSTLGVDGNVRVGSAGTSKLTVDSSNGNVVTSGTLNVAGNVTVNTDKFQVNAGTGNTSIAGTLTVTGASTFNSNVSAGGNYITNLADPVNPQDAATKAYVDAARAGLDVKESVKAATTANVTLSGTQTIDGVALTAGDRVLVKDQTVASQNGIYVVAGGAWARSDDADNTPGAEVTNGMFVFVEAGTTNGKTGYVLVTSDPITLGTTGLEFALFSISGTVIAGNGLSKTGDQLEVNVDPAGGIEISGDNLRIKATAAGAGLVWDANTTGIFNVVGTADRITVNPDSVDIASTYVGQTSITTLGTISTGTWEADILDPTYGGTGVNNGSKTITLGGNLTTSGAHTTTLTTTANTSVTLPTTGTLATLAGSESLTNKEIDSSNIGATTPGTGNFTTLEADSFTITDTTQSTNATTGALVISGGVGIAKNLNVGENLTVDGKIFNRTVGGTVLTEDEVIQFEIATTSPTVIDSFSATAYRSAKYLIQISQGSDYQVSEFRLIHNGSQAFVTEYSVLETNGALASAFTASVGGGNVSVSATMNSASNATVNMVRTTVVV